MTVPPTGPAPSLPPAGWSRRKRFLHVALWTLLFYVLALLVAKISEWASP